VKLEPGKEYAATENALLRHYKQASPQERESLNLEIRRNIYDQKGKDLTADSKAKQANGEEGTTNGASGGDLPMKTIEDIAKEPTKPIHCYSCAIDCTRLRYHYAKTHSPSPMKQERVVFDLCPACFLSGKHAGHNQSIDFVKLEDPSYTGVPDKDAPWTEDELLLLLEGLESYDENWNKISDHVGSRTREECVVKFLQLEIEDKYLEPEANGQPSYGPLDNGRVPFSQADNPVMSVLGFLAGMSEPAVAAAAAGRSVKEMEKAYRKRLNKGLGGEPVGSGKDKEAVKTEDTMDVDDAASPQADDTNQVAVSSADRPKDAASFVATSAFATSAARAAALASDEEREMTRLVSAAVNTTLQKFELKLQQFSEMESMFQAERRELDRGRQQLFLDRLAFRKRVSETQEALRLASQKGGEEGARLAQNIPVGGGERMGFEQDLSRGNVQPLAPGDPGYKSYEI
jgi:SWI/SNF related-matrix-associated actin-dependent regulator of chromatin subfamily C